MNKLSIFTIACWLFIAPALTIPAQDAPPPPPVENADKDPQDPKLRERLRNLSPEERQRLRKNLERWEKMAPEMRERMRGRHARMMEHVREEITRIIEESGVELNEERRREFAESYMRMRRELERELQDELDRKRREELPELVEKVKAQFPEFQTDDDGQ